MNLKNIFKSFFYKVTFGLFTYPVNDPAVPLLVSENIPNLPNPCPAFSVQGFTGQGGQPGTQEFQGAFVYTTIAHMLNLVQTRTASPITQWARTQNLIAIPRAGVDWNAYYDGGSLRFFYNRNPQNGKVVYMCESSDVVSHELGHAVLDVLRPDLWSVAAMEVPAFHESFGDMMAVISALIHDEVVKFVIQETGGDLRKPNMVSRLAEEMGSAISGRAGSALRNAMNPLKYVPPETLPSYLPGDQLSHEPHSFSRVFTGGFYDLLIWIFERDCKTKDQVSALHSARDEIATILLRAIPHAASTPRFYDSVVRAMLIADSDAGMGCSEGIRNAFTARGILQPSPMNVKPTIFKMDGKNAKVNKHKHGTAVRVASTNRLKLADNLLMAQSNNKLYTIDLDVPSEHYLEYDESGRLKLERPLIKEEVVNCAKAFVDYLSKTDKVSDDPMENKEFIIQDGRLQRNFICRH